MSDNKKIPTHFVIDVTKWRCGGGIQKSNHMPNVYGLGVTQLLNDEGFMCCLGQISLQLGIESSKLKNQDSPTNVSEKFGIRIPILTYKRRDDAEELYWRSTRLALCAIKINDQYHQPIEDKKAQLKELFQKHNLFIKFVGEPVVNTR